MSIEHRGKNSWRIGVKVDTGSGWEWIRETLRMSPGMSEARQRKEAEKALARLQTEADEGRLRPSAHQHTVRTFSELWMQQHVTPTLSPTTAKTYRNFLDTRILPALGDIALRQLTPLRITQWLTTLRESPRLSTILPDEALKNPRHISDTQRHERVKEAGTKPLSPRTVQHYYNALSAMLDKAVQWDQLRKSPMAQVDRPLARKSHVQYLTEERAVDLLRCLQQEPSLSYRAAVLLALLCGLRLGEVGALKLSDVDWHNQTIDITRARKYAPQTGNFNGDTKSVAGERLIAIPDGMMDLLRASRDVQTEHAALLGDRWQGDGWIIHTWDGAQMHHDTPSKWFRKFADAHGFEGIRFHDLRHTHATILLANNMDVVAVSSRMGHSDASVTLKIYAHALRRRDNESAQVMQNLINESSNPAQPSTSAAADVEQISADSNAPAADNQHT